METTKLIRKIEQLRKKGYHSFSIERGLSAFNKDAKQATVIAFRLSDSEAQTILKEFPFIVDDRD